MQGHSDRFAATVRGSHSAVCRGDALQYGQVVRQLAVHAGSVTADRTAAQMRAFDIEVSDPTDTLTPEGATSLLAPFVTRIQLWRGVRHQATDSVTTPASWGVSGTSTGVMDGVIVDGAGVLTLGP